MCGCLGKACPAQWQATQNRGTKSQNQTWRRRGGRARARIRVSYWDLGFETSIPAELRTKVACERGHRLGFLFGIWILGPRFRPNCVWRSRESVHVLGLLIEIWILGFGLEPNCRRRQLSRQHEWMHRLGFYIWIWDLDSSQTAYKCRVRDGRVTMSACTDKVFMLGAGI
jgi:hypothetical protein